MTGTTKFQAFQTDSAELQDFGYKQQLNRTMGGFSVHYSRTGYKARLADALIYEFNQRGHDVVMEALRVKRDWNKWLLPVPLLPLLPLLPVYLISARFRRFWHVSYRQQEQAIWPLAKK